MDQFDTVVVFGDSLSDIGTKWKTRVGNFAINQGQMHVSPTGRFSDCRNWADHMVEAAGLPSLVAQDVQSSIDASKMHHQISTAPVTVNDGKDFRYANYAAGGACGASHWSVTAIAGLSTFENQVTQFLKDLQPKADYGKILFFIWFGANDIYTAGASANSMGGVAATMFQQRDKLGTKFPDASFVFMDLAYPLSSVRYNQFLKRAEKTNKVDVQTRVNVTNPIKNAVMSSPHANARGVQEQYLAHKVRKSTFLADINNQGKPAPRKGWVLWAQLAIQNNIPVDESLLKGYRAQVALITELENGVRLFNAALHSGARIRGDQVVELSATVSPGEIAKLVESSTCFRKGAMNAEAQHIGSREYEQNFTSAPLTTIDEAHPTDLLYMIMWREIYRVLVEANYTFGNLPNRRRLLYEEIK
jgi:hypothetical protein